MPGEKRAYKDISTFFITSNKKLATEAASTLSTKPCSSDQILVSGTDIRNACECDTSESNKSGNENANATGEKEPLKVTSSADARSFEMYKGIQLKLKSIVKRFDFYEVTQVFEPSTRKKRKRVKCTVCSEYKYEAQKQTRNNQLPLADGGVYAYARGHFINLIDHVETSSHKAAMYAKATNEKWQEKSADHPWLKLQLKHEEEVVANLIPMAMDAYNDCLYERNSAYSWPSRSLTHLASNSLLGHMKDNGPSAEFQPYKPTAGILHYRDPVYYGEMVSCIAELELKKLQALMETSVVYAIQVDGSVDKRMIDNKFISCTMLLPNNEVKTCFLEVNSPVASGASGLLEATLHALNNCKASLDKIVGITTDGEAANTGRHAGLWKLLQDAIQRNILTLWCNAHRSDLAFEEIIASVPELRIWLQNLTSVASYFRCSSKRSKLLSEFEENAKKFPKYHEVRFAQHLLKLVDATLENLPAVMKVWQKLSEEGDRREKTEAAGFLKLFDKKQVWLTALMGDVLEIFQHMQQQLQRTSLILPDVLTCTEAAQRKLQLMSTCPYPGKREAKFSSILTDLPLPNEAGRTNISEKLKLIYSSSYNFLLHL
jgi:hypothetical protein